MRRFNVAQARRMLRQAVTQLQPAAVDYIDWIAFEAELNKVMGVTDPSKPKIVGVFAQAVTKARQAYMQAVRTGGAWKQQA